MSEHRTFFYIFPISRLNASVACVVQLHVLGHVASCSTCQVMCASFSEDGGLLASGCSDGQLRFWKDAEQVHVGLGDETSTSTSRPGVKSVNFIPA